VRWSQLAPLLGAAAWQGRPLPDGFAPVVDPRRVVAYVPALHSPPPGRAPEPRDDFWAGPKAAGPGAEDPGSPGVLSSAEFGQSPPPQGTLGNGYGLNGLTRLGRRRIQAGAQLLEEDRLCCSFWTINLSDEANEQLAELGSWWRFQEAIRKELGRLLHRRGIKPRTVAVVEIGPRRSERQGRPVPHLHILFQGKRNRYSHWAISTDELDNLILMAIRRAGGTSTDIRSSGNVQAIHTSAAGYLTKYITKTTARKVPPGSDWRLIPRQWWFMSAALLEEVVALTIRLPAHFLAWMIDRREPARRGQLYQCSPVPNLPRGAPSCWMVCFRSADAAWALWEHFEMAHRISRARCAGTA